MNGRSVLVVDDDPKALELIEAILIPAGYFVITLDNSTKIVETVRDMQPDIILLDIMMPFEDGLAVLAKLKKGDKRSNIPVVMVTALADSDHKVSSAIDGASAYVTKPINRTLLLETIARLLPDSTVE